MALRHRDWVAEGFKTLVVASDFDDLVSSYAAFEASECHLQCDMEKDTWQMLLAEVEKCRERGLEVKFWKIPRAMNSVANEEARKVLTRKDDGGLEDGSEERSRRAPGALLRRSTFS